MATAALTVDRREDLHPAWRSTRGDTACLASEGESKRYVEHVEADRTSDSTAVGSGGWTRIGLVPPNTTTFLDPNVGPRASYRYRVRATRGSTASAWSNEASVTIP
jgi:hypothetical protein